MTEEQRYDADVSDLVDNFHLAAATADTNCAVVIGAALQMLATCLALTATTDPVAARQAGEGVRRALASIVNDLPQGMMQ